MNRRSFVGLLTGPLLVPASAQAFSIDFFNGVRVGQEIPATDIKYLTAAPSGDASLTMIYFWGTWCGPCRETIPKLNLLQESRATKGLVIVGLTDETEKVVKDFMQKISIQYTVGLDVGRKLFGPLKIRALPYAILIDKSRKVVWRGQPEELHNDELDALLAATSARH